MSMWPSACMLLFFCFQCQLLLGKGMLRQMLELRSWTHAVCNDPMGLPIRKALSQELSCIFLTDRKEIRYYFNWESYSIICSSKTTTAATRCWITEVEITISRTKPRTDTLTSKCLPHNEENAVLPLQLLLASPSWRPDVLLSVTPFKCHPFAGKHNLGVTHRYTPQETAKPWSHWSGLS